MIRLKLDYLLQKLGEDLNRFSESFLREICQVKGVTLKPSFNGGDDLGETRRATIISALKDSAVDYYCRLYGRGLTDVEAKEFKSVNCSGKSTILAEA